MKKKFTFIMIALFTFCFIFISCGEEDKFDSNLTGTWIGEEGDSITFDGNGAFTGSISFEGFTLIGGFTSIKHRGTYETSGDKITMTVTGVSIDNGVTWLNKNEITAMAAVMGDYGELILEMLEPQTGTYNINGNKLTITSVVSGESSTITYTKQ